MTPRHFLNIESSAYWQADQSKNYLFSNIWGPKDSLHITPTKGDYIITFVQDSGFADIRYITSEQLIPQENTRRVPVIHKYKTEILEVLHDSHHVPAETLHNLLDLCEERPQWRQSMNHSLIELSQEDGAMLMSLVVAKAKTERITGVRCKTGAIMFKTFPCYVY